MDMRQGLGIDCVEEELEFMDAWWRGAQDVPPNPVFSQESGTGPAACLHALRARVCNLVAWTLRER